MGKDKTIDQKWDASPVKKYTEEEKKKLLASIKKQGDKK